MKKGAVSIIPLRPEHFEPYIQVGTTSYYEHYLHLWKNRDPTYYIENAFRPDVVQKEWEDPEVSLYLIYLKNLPVGILKIILNKTIEWEQNINCLFLERIYILAAYTGKGIGQTALDFAETLAREKGQSQICLETMQKGPALDFYKKNGYAILGGKQLDFPGMVAAERPMYILGKALL